MGAPVMLRNIRDTYVSSTQPTVKFNDRVRLWLKSGERYAYIYFARPFPLGVTIVKATLRVKNRDLWAGANTISVRRIAEQWFVGQTTFNKKPSVYSVIQSLQKTGAAALTEWALDVTPEMQAVSNGTKWWGFRLEIDSATARALVSSRGLAENRPTLEIEWSDAPDEPEDMWPSAGRAVSLQKPVVRCDFTDLSGDTTINAIQVQTAATSAALTANTPVFDSGTVLVDVPELDLSTTAFAGINVDQIIFWRVRVQDGAGLWSGWSRNESFTRKDKGVLTLTNPPVAETIKDPTPPILWTFTGKVQRAYQIIVLNSNTGAWVWDSGKKTSTDQAVTLPVGVVKRTDTTYRVVLRVWDTENREGTPGDDAYVQVIRNFTYAYDPLTDPVQNFTVTPDPVYPWVTLAWTRPTAPDSFSIWRDNKIIDAAIPPEELSTGGLGYSYVDKTSASRTAHDWKILCIVNGNTSNANPVVNKATKSVSTCVARRDGTDPVILLNPEREMEWMESSEVHDILGDGPPVLITQSIGGYAGVCAGRLATYNGVSAQAFRSRLEEFKQEQGKPFVLSLVDESFEAILHHINWQPVPMPDGSTEYDVSFEFYQNDQPSWEG